MNTHKPAALLRRISATAAVLTLPLYGLKAQTLIAHYPLTTNSNDVTANYTAMTYGTSATQAPNACSDGTVASAIATPPLGSLFNKTNFAVEIHVSLNSYATYIPTPIFMIDRASRTIGVSVTTTGMIGYSYNDAFFTNSGVQVALNQVDTIMLKYVSPNVELFLNGRLIQSATLPSLFWSPGSSAHRLTTANTGTAEALDGCISNLKIYSGGVVLPIDLISFNAEALDGCISNLKIYSGGVVLPIDLISFDAEALTGGRARLRWETGAGDDTHRFDIERSMDGAQWNVIGAVSQPDETVTTRKFAYVDGAAPGGAAVYYRLRAVDAAGSVTYSRVAKLQVSGLAVRPELAVNPVAGTLTLRNWAGGELRVYDVTGRRVAVLDMEAGGSVDVSGLAPGSYVLRLNADGVQTVLRFQKL